MIRKKILLGPVKKEKEISIFERFDNPILMKLGTQLHFLIFYIVVI